MRLDLYQAETARIASEQSALLDECAEYAFVVHFLRTPR